MEILIKIFVEVFWFLIIYGTMIIYMLNVPRALHYMQLDGYKNNEFTKWITKNPKLAFKSGTKQLIVVAGFYAFITIVHLLIQNKSKKRS